MAKDYAKYTGKNRPVNKPRQLDLIIILLMILFLIGSAGWIYTFKLRKDFSASHMTSFVTNIKDRWQQKFKSAPPAQLAAQANKPPIKHEQEVQFDFYSELPNMQVQASTIENNPSTPPLVNTPPNKMVTAVEKTEQAELVPPSATAAPAYWVKIAAYQDMNAASQARLSLLLAGIDAEIVKTNNEYVIQRGPYPGPAEAKYMQKKLKQKGIESEIVK